LSKEKKRGTQECRNAESNSCVVFFTTVSTSISSTCADIVATSAFEELVAGFLEEGDLVVEEAVASEERKKKKATTTRKKERKKKDVLSNKREPGFIQNSSFVQVFPFQSA
jgi:adenylylsulfate kinase-like enzyme